MKSNITNGEKNTRIFIGSTVLFAAIIYTSYLAHKLLQSLLDKFNPNEVLTNSLISYGGALILSGVILFYGILQDKNEKYNSSFKLAFIMVLFDFAAYYRGLNIVGFSYENLAPAVILSCAIPFIIHFLSHDIAVLLWHSNTYEDTLKSIEKEAKEHEIKLQEIELAKQEVRTAYEQMLNNNTAKHRAELAELQANLDALIEKQSNNTLPMLVKCETDDCENYFPPKANKKSCSATCKQKNWARKQKENKQA